MSNPVPQMHYFVKKDFSSLLEIQSKRKLKSNLVAVNLVIGNKQLGIGKLNYLCLLMYNPHKERQEEHLQALTALSVA